MASMGPRSFNRGNVAFRGAARPQENSFNGAAVFQPRKSVVEEPGRRFVSELQWGRGLSTAEINNARKMVLDWKELQWGRGLSTAEIL